MGMKKIVGMFTIVIGVMFAFSLSMAIILTVLPLTGEFESVGSADAFKSWSTIRVTLPMTPRRTILRFSTTLYQLILN